MKQQLTYKIEREGVFMGLADGFVCESDEVKLYEGMEYSKEIGEYDYNFRNYNPTYGIFLKADSMLPDVYDPQQLNRYMFERGNPYGGIDVDGHNYISLLDPKGAARAGHSAGMVYNENGATFYSHEAKDFSLTSLKSMITNGVESGDVYLEASSIDELYKQHGDILNRYTHSYEVQTNLDEDNIISSNMKNFYNSNFEYNLAIGNCDEAQTMAVKGTSVQRANIPLPTGNFYGSMIKQKIHDSFNKFINNVKDITLGGNK